MRTQEDLYYHKGMRRQLVQQLQTKGITDQKVLDAINAVPRHFFLDSAFDRIAYEDKAFDIGEGQTISHPFTVAYQTQLLQLEKKDSVLEIGTGSAYQACVLAQYGCRIFTIERQKSLFFNNQSFTYLRKHNNIKLFYGDGYAGLAAYAPFDKIIVTAAAPFIPPKLLEQLKVGGIMVIPVDGENGKQTMLRLTKQEDNSIEQETFMDFEFVPMLTGKNQ
ncbi:MAG: protein-L-isoaspartate O-methyltransferase [Pseudopedobacter saltans]|uniref:Protein-L-isoaspartate O-methyltransferase n=1 Tax=Pseudopedobacter saltans TaxID=151895 RepID=A0A2W5FDD0_9SPHI|nr:MAG: protein-L-isoaspartate O-methyltransferase [Pseudopedobacter saltans]